MNPCLHRWNLLACLIVCFLGLSALLMPPTAEGRAGCARPCLSAEDWRHLLPIGAACRPRCCLARCRRPLLDARLVCRVEPGQRGVRDLRRHCGDVNGDGYSDVIVGADSYTSDHQYEGAAFVYLGSADGLPDSFHWMAVGGQADAAFGLSVAPAGDVNADGYADVIVGRTLLRQRRDQRGPRLRLPGVRRGSRSESGVDIREQSCGHVCRLLCRTGPAT